MAGQSDAKSPDVSIVYTNWNTGHLLRDCLISMYKVSEGFTYEVIVVDDGSTDDSVEMLVREFPDVTVLQNRKNEGVARSYNRGMHAARGKYIQILNSDMLFVGNSIKVLLDFLEHHKDVAAAGSWLLNRDLSSQISYGDFPTFTQALVDALFLNDLFPRANFPNRGRPPFPHQKTPIEVDYVTGASMLIRSEVLQTIGYLDTLYTSYCEETDLCYRIRHDLGKKVFFLPDAKIIHFGGASFEKLRKLQIQLLSSSYNKFLIKHHGRAYAWATRAIYLWTHSIKLVIRSMALVFSSSHSRSVRKNSLLNGWYAFCSTLFPGDPLRTP